MPAGRRQLLRCGPLAPRRGDGRRALDPEEPPLARCLPDFLPLGWTPVVATELLLADPATGTELPETTNFAADAVHLDLPLPSWITAGDEPYAVTDAVGGHIDGETRFAKSQHQGVAKQFPGAVQRFLN